jgi:peptidoglycan/xylan/chitin deacetylase (PgdA/CDA1 family)
MSANTNTTFSYLKTGHTGNRSLSVNINSYKCGDAHYKFKRQPVVPGAEYEFSFYYQSNVPIDVIAEVYNCYGNISYDTIGTLVPSTSWNKFVAIYTMPEIAINATIYPTLAANGSLTTDDYSLVRTNESVPLKRAIVTLSHDESASTVHQYGYPLYKKYNMVGDIYIRSGQLGEAGTMSKKQYNDFRKLGFEIGSHTVTHPHLPEVNATNLTDELKDSQSAISKYFDGTPVPSFATPYGEYNAHVVNEIKNYYQNHRTTDVGLNSRDNFDPYLIKCYSIESDMHVDYTLNLIDQAIKDKAWLCLVYHDVKPDDGSGFLWTTTPENMETTLAYLKKNNVSVQTTSQAVSEIKAQM